MLKSIVQNLKVKVEAKPRVHIAADAELYNRIQVDSGWGGEKSRTLEHNRSRVYYQLYCRILE